MAARNLAVMRELAAKQPEGKPKRVVFKYFHSPTAILGDERVEGIELVRNVLDENERAVATDETETLECQLVFRSVGYRGVELPGVPFDERGGTIANDGGRVTDGVYCAGWIKRGPTGVIGTNKKDATETVELLLADVAAGRTAAEARSDRRGGRRAARRARRARRRLRGLDGDRRGRARGRRAERPPAGEVLLVGRASRRRRAQLETPPLRERRRGWPPMGPGWNRSSWNAFAAAPRVSRAATCSSTSRRPSASTADTSAGRPSSRSPLARSAGRGFASSPSCA